MNLDSRSPLAASPPFDAFFFSEPLTRLFPQNHRNQKKTALPRVPHLRRLRHRHLHLHSVERLERRGPLLPRLRQLRRVATGRLPPLRRRGPRCADGAEGARREELRPLRQAVNLNSPPRNSPPSPSSLSVFPSRSRAERERGSEERWFGLESP